MKLSEILNEILISEMSQNATLYHRTTQKYEVGDVVKPGNRDYVVKSYFERAMEYYRQKNYPNEPSRLTAVFASVVPRSRFRQKGQLYTVKLNTSNWLFTNSQLIDELNNDFTHNTNRDVDDFSIDHLKDYTDEQLHDYFLDTFTAERYWQGTKRGDTEGIEILADSFIVTGIEDGKVLLRRGEKVKSIKSMRVHVSGFFNDPPWKADVVIEELNKFIVGDLKIEKMSFGSGQFSISGDVNLKPNVILYVTDMNDPMAQYNKSTRKEYSRKPSLTVVIYRPWAENEKDKFPYIRINTINPKDIANFKRV